MVFDQPDPITMFDAESSTAYTAITPPETVAADNLDDLDPLGDSKINSSSSVPWPGSTFIIRCATSGHVLTLRDGQVVLVSPGDRGSIHWECVENKGWLGFQNVVSGRFLGHDDNGRLRCSAARQLGWENFCVRMRPEGGYVLLLTHWERLWHVGMRRDRDGQRLAKIEDGGAGGVVWEFVKV